MTAIPGAEYAPTLNQTLIADGLTISVQRRLDVSDPDDQRVIYRMAALARGLSEKDAATAILCQTAWYRPGAWCLQYFVAGHGGRREESSDHMCLLPYADDGRVELHGVSRAKATAALCRAIWGPR